MNIRKLKRTIYSRMWNDLFRSKPIGQTLMGYLPAQGEVLMVDDVESSIDWKQIAARQAQRMLVEEPVEEVCSLGDLLRQKMEQDATFTVARKKDGVIVGTYTTEAEAQAVIDKAKAAKKATLVLV